MRTTEQNRPAADVQAEIGEREQAQIAWRLEREQLERRSDPDKISPADATRHAELSLKISATPARLDALREEYTARKTAELLSAIEAILPELGAYHALRLDYEKALYKAEVLKQRAADISEAISARYSLPVFVKLSSLFDQLRQLKSLTKLQEVELSARIAPPRRYLQATEKQAVRDQLHDEMEAAYGIVIPNRWNS